MTVETEVANLTTAVDNLAEAVNVKKATLDASVADAESARDAAAASATTASGHATSAAASAAAAASTASGIAGFDLDAIAASKAVTAVDVFVYDTSKDSDGGAWRKRTQHTSWYNETLNTATRGSRREFPAVAVIVAESGRKITIYDGDDPALPMWMVFSQGVLAYSQSSENFSLFAKETELAIGSSTGVYRVSFIKDSMRFQQSGNDRTQQPISTRGSSSMVVNGLAKYIVNNTVNDVAMTVLPNSPIDPATGLPVPTIAVATDGGVSVIKDDGTVVDFTVSYYGITNHLDFNGSILLLNYGTSSDSSGLTYTLDVAEMTGDLDIVNNNTDYLTSSVVGFGSGSITPRLLSNSNKGQHWTAKGQFARGSSLGMTHYLADKVPGTNQTASVAYTTSTYNTGWMPGDIKGAFLADTDDTDLVGSTLAEDFTTYADQAAAEAAGWSFTATSFDAGLDAIVFNGTGSANATLYGTMIADAGITGAYEVTVVVSGVTAGSISVQDNFVTVGAFAANGTHVFRGVRAGGFRFVTGNGFDGEIESVTFKALDYDRSVNNNGLIVNGTVTRSAVATGAELVAYSGFSASNYLEQPYNSALDFGTGDFCVMGWVKSTNASGADTVLDRSASLGITGLYIYVQAGGNLAGRVGAGSAVDRSFGAVSNTGWRHFALLRSSGNCYCYLDGNLTLSFAEAGNISGTSLATRVGLALDGSNAGNATSLALLRISATAPTAEQIKRIYEDEKVLFQENAACTLYGTSNNVMALAHDEDTGLLHVGTSAGRSVFQGLRRVSNTTTAVGTAISASNGLVVEE